MWKVNKKTLSLNSSGQSHVESLIPTVAQRGRHRPSGASVLSLPSSARIFPAFERIVSPRQAGSGYSSTQSILDMLAFLCQFCYDRKIVAL